AFHGIADQAAVRPGEWVAIFGMGGVGLSAVQIAAAIGARVIAVGRSTEKLLKAIAEGAETTLKANVDVPAEITEITKGGAAVTLDAPCSIETTPPALPPLCQRGRHGQPRGSRPAGAAGRTASSGSV